jgi:hypothetical protein
MLLTGNSRASARMIDAPSRVRAETAAALNIEYL